MAYPRNGKVRAMLGERTATYDEYYGHDERLYGSVKSICMRDMLNVRCSTGNDRIGKIFRAELLEFLEDMGLSFETAVMFPNGNFRLFRMFGTSLHIIGCIEVSGCWIVNPEINMPEVRLRMFYGQGKVEWTDRLGLWEDGREPYLHMHEGYYPYGFRYMRYMRVFSDICQEMEKRGIYFRR